MMTDQKKDKKLFMVRGGKAAVTLLCAMFLFSGCGKADRAYSKGMEYAQKGDYKKSAHEFTTAIKADDKNVNSYIGYGMSLNYLKQYEQAEKVFASVFQKEGLKVTTEEKMAIYYGRAVAAFGKKEYEKAVEYSDKALSYEKGKKDSKNISDMRKSAVQSYYYLGLSKMKIKQYEEAKADLEKYVKYAQKEHTANAYNQIANCMVQLEDYDGAKKYVEQGLQEKDEKMTQILEKNRVIIYEKSGDYKEALGYAKQYIKSYPDDEGMQKEMEFIKTRL